MAGKLNIWFSAFDKLYDNEDINKLGKYKTAYQPCSQRGQVIVTWSRISHGLPVNVQNFKGMKPHFNDYRSQAKLLEVKNIRHKISNYFRKKGWGKSSSLALQPFKFGLASPHDRCSFCSLQSSCSPHFHTQIHQIQFDNICPA